MKIKKTIVRFDFAGSKEVTDNLNHYGGSSAVRGFTDIIGELLTEALPKGIQKKDLLLRLEGDGGYLMFKNADDAHNFAIKFHSNEREWRFRIGAATGQIDINKASSDKIVGQPIGDAQRLEKYGAETGCICIDDATYNALSSEFKEKYNSQKNVKGNKPTEKEIPAWCYQVISKDSLNLPQNNISPEKCVTLLRSLDYAPHEDYFRKLIELKEIAFFIQASNAEVQNWLIERLVYHVPSSIQAKKYLIDFQTLALKSCIENFWHEFIDTPTNANPNITSAINYLTDVCHNRPVIILMRRLNYLDQETVAQIFKFWDELVQKIRSTQNRTIKSRFVLLLVAEPTEYKNKSVFLKEKFNFTKLNPTTIKKILKQKNTQSRDIFLLSPMDKLDPKDVQDWLQKTEVLLSLKFHEQNYIDKLLSKTIPRWGNVPENVLNDICIHVFNLRYGFAEIEEKCRW